MLSFKRGRVLDITSSDSRISFIKVEVEEELKDAINYNFLTGKIDIGDQVVLNTTATELNLGTGGFDFVINNLSMDKKDFEEDGHIMKLRYTPFQIKCLAAEAEESVYHDIFLNFEDLNNHLCIVGTLHSMLAPIITTLKYLNPNLKINYIMTDGGCLPIDFSNTVRQLKSDGLINKTITIGHAFGGDLECINIYNGLIASKEIAQGDITIITMGPGIVGSGTPYGYSGIEQGHIIDVINKLGGYPIMVPRIGFNDKRERHIGISHHTITTIKKGLNSNAVVVLGEMDIEKKNLIDKQKEDLDIKDKVIFEYEGGHSIFKALKKYGYNVKTMGRGIEEEKEYFLTLGAAAEYSNKIFLEGIVSDF